MQQRKSAAGRPTGTDGSDFSYRMVVDSRYTKVAQGKSRLRVLILAQAVIHLVGLLYVFLSASKGNDLNTLAIYSASAGLVSLLIGELGRKRSRISLLSICMLASTLASVVSTFAATRSKLVIQDVQASSGTESVSILEHLDSARVFVGCLVQLFIVFTINSLNGNMSLPKKDS